MVSAQSRWLFVPLILLLVACGGEDGEGDSPQTDVVLVDGAQQDVTPDSGQEDAGDDGESDADDGGEPTDTGDDATPDSDAGGEDAEVDADNPDATDVDPSDADPGDADPGDADPGDAGDVANDLGDDADNDAQPDAADAADAVEDTRPDAEADAADDTVDPDSGEDADVAEPACDDGVENGDETDVDCGGICAPCVSGQGCVLGEDCTDGVCDEGVCLSASCTDGELNGTETDIDCGGEDCLPCLEGNDCVVPSDCFDGVCSVIGRCLPAACGDAVRNGDEACDDGNAVNTDACRNNCTLPVCGDGIVDAGEACDDGNAVDIDGCRNDCTSALCGDGVVNAGEACDDGNAVNTDACRNNCTLPGCGDGVVDTGEACDDGNAVNTDGCRNDCTAPACGDGIVDTGEACDDGNAVNTDACRNDCSAPSCGDGVLDSGEACDDGNAVNTDLCRNDCSAPFCGDGIVDVGETCDDGNAVDTDGCRNDCTSALCGDGVVDAGEACDDGNAVNTDACRNTCVLPVCGDGIVDAGEACDDGNAVNTDACRNSCVTPRCGDGVLDADEECDDGNDIDADACRNSCVAPFCGDGVVDAGEECDDGNDDNTDACRDTCATPVCGDGIVDDGEDCDDGNDEDADGCSNTCVGAVCGDGIVFGDEECDDGNDDDSDACTSLCLEAACGDGTIQAYERETTVLYDFDDGFIPDDFDALGDAAWLADADDDGGGLALRSGAISHNQSTSFAFTISSESAIELSFDWRVSSESCCDDLALLVDGTVVREISGQPGWASVTQPITAGTRRIEFRYSKDGSVSNGEDAGFVDNLSFLGQQVRDEACDDGDANSDTAPDACRTDCRPASCGDGVADASEACDDGNRDASDMCTNTCTVAACGDDVVAATEECDDGNTTPFDGCDPTCNTEICPLAAITTVMGSAGLTGSTCSATSHDAAPLCASSSSSPEFPVQFTASIDGEYQFLVDGDFDTILYLRDECGGAELACDNPTDSTQSRVSTVLRAGQTVTIYVASPSSSCGNFALSVGVTPIVLDCSDGWWGPGETGVDCGGVCGPCDDGERCVSDDDCAGDSCMVLDEYISICGSSETVCPGQTFESDFALSTFGASGCTVVDGDLEIRSGVTSQAALDHLDDVVAVTGRVYVYYADLPTEISLLPSLHTLGRTLTMYLSDVAEVRGLQSLRTACGIELFGYDFEEIPDFESLVSVGFECSLTRSTGHAISAFGSSLRQVPAFPRLTRTRGLSMRTDAVTTIDAFPVLREIALPRVVSTGRSPFELFLREGVTVFDGFHAVESIEGELNLWLTAGAFFSGFGSLTNLEDLNVELGFGADLVDTFGSLEHAEGELRVARIDNDVSGAAATGVSVLFPSLTEVEVLTLNGLGLTSLDAFPLLDSVRETIDIQDLPTLASVAGTAGMAGATELRFDAVNQLVDLAPLTDLTRLNEVWISNAASLNSIAGPAYPAAMERIDLENLPSLPSLAPLAGLRAIDTLEINNLDALPSVDELVSLRSIDAYFSLQDSSAVQELSLPSLLSASTVYVYRNAALTGIDFPNLRVSSGSVTLRNLPSLASGILAPTLSGVEGDLRIEAVGDMPSLNLPALLTVEGTLALESLADTTTLTFPVLANVDYTLSITDNPVLQSLDGFSALTTIGYHLLLSRNAVLPDVDGFGALTSVAGDLIIYGNVALTQLDGFSNLTVIDGFGTAIGGTPTFCFGQSDLCIQGNPLLTDIDGFDALTEIGEVEIRSNSGLLDVSGFPLLSTVDWELAISGNSVLADVSGFAALESVGTQISISSNSALADVTGFVSLEEWPDWLRVGSNPTAAWTWLDREAPTLPTSLEISGQGALTLLSSFSTIDGDLEISGQPPNQLPGVTTVNGDLLLEELNDYENLDGLSGMRTVTGDVGIEGNLILTDVSGLSGLTTVGGHLSVYNNRVLPVCRIQDLFDTVGFATSSIYSNGPTCP